MVLSPTAMPRKPLPPLRVGTSCGAQTSSPLTCALAAAGSSAGGTMLTWVSHAAPKLQGGTLVLLTPSGVGVPILGVSQA